MHRRAEHGAMAAFVLVVLAAVSAPPPQGWTDPAFYDGTRFRQPEPLQTGFADWLRREGIARGAWRAFTDAPPGPAPPRCVEDGRLRVTFVNHSTVLIQMDGWNVLTDPTWAERSAPLVGSHRRRPPGVRFEDLPPVDVVLVSHDHHDHMDLPTLERLQAAWQPRLYTGLGNAAFLERHGIHAAGQLDWWQSVPIGNGLVLTAVPARHMSGRSLFGRDRRLWCGFVLSGPSGSVYFAGDTGWGSLFAPIAEAFPNLRLALLPIGGFQPAWYMREQHMGPEDAVAAHRLLGAGTSVPIHFGTFPNAADGELEPAAALRAVLARSPDVAPHFVLLDNGESIEVPPAR
jgi:L-ascorbate metabolism protein UlaG (beta-lactamase superfamily)